jgi:hypothetical protein
MNRIISSAVLVSTAILAAILSATPVLASENLSGKGVMVIDKWKTEETCDTSSYPVIICDIAQYGSIHGTLTGPLSLVMHLTITYISSQPLVRQWVGSATITCDPCSVNRLVGTVTLESSWDETTIADSVIHATFTSITGTGGLAGIGGTGTYFSAPPSSQYTYSVQLTLP